ncbi:hypothetical protein Sp245p_26445 (plasmid) [Azospirillum baldaniorum]|nr:hypothetical protein Sp245p_26445 [Azospirillum baldaniorum]
MREPGRISVGIAIQMSPRSPLVQRPSASLTCQLGNRGDPLQRLVDAARKAFSGRVAQAFQLHLGDPKAKQAAVAGHAQALRADGPRSDGTRS